ncbi:hypothetical protein D8T65_18970 [Vibrio vulnificus]|nr:hypothetical protein D8T65_18970 [Vibrio vulnificus]
MSEDYVETQIVKLLEVCFQSTLCSVFSSNTQILISFVSRAPFARFKMLTFKKTVQEKTFIFNINNLIKITVHFMQ